MPDGNRKSQNAPEPFRYTLITDAPHPMSLLDPVLRLDPSDISGDTEQEESDIQVAKRYRERYGHHDGRDCDLDDKINSWG